MFKNAIRLFSVNGFEIRIDPSWLIIAALITWSLSQRYFPINFPDQSSQTYLVMAVVAMMFFFTSLLLHELAHSVVARRLGVPINSITLFLFGGVAELEAEPTSAKAELYIAVAGPIMSLVLGVMFWILAVLFELLIAPSSVTKVLTYLAVINIILAVFNLIPAFPLDGGRILRAYLWHRSGNVLKATQQAANSGKILAYFLMSLGVIAMFQGAVVNGLWQIMIGSFILVAARSSYQHQLANVVFDSKSVSDLMKRNPIVVHPNVSLADFVNQTMLRYGVSFVPVLEDGIVLGHMDRTVLSGIDRENWASTYVGDVFVKLDKATTLRPDLPVRDLMHIISQTGERKFLIIEDQKLVGIISLADLTNYLQMYDQILQ